MLIIVNQRAGGGTAARKWARIAPAIKERLGNFDLAFLDNFSDAAAQIHAGLRSGERQFIAAGGDGTVNFLLNTLFDSAPAEVIHDIAIGAIGLGSSNDFHKPFDPGRYISDIPCRIEFAAARPHDVGNIQYSENSGNILVRHWLINTSIGITAEANRLFNNPDRVLYALKRSSTGLAIVYSALKTLFRYKAMRIDLSVDDTEAKPFEIENIGLVKNPNFSGNFRYDSPYEIDSGRFYLHIVERRPLVSKLRLLYQLSKPPRKDRGLTISRPAKFAQLSSVKPFAVEFDGEIIVADKIRINILNKAIKVAS